ncbi:MAG: MliC family protein [Patescibacteria group bacterium]|nr:MliC family protein [Patescibacteria group bacterium]
MKSRGVSTGYIIFVIALIVLAGLAYYYRDSSWFANLIGASATTTEVARASYACDGGKTIDAIFYQNTRSAATSTPQGMPIPAGSVHLGVSDGRTMTLPQTVSADGSRYSNGDPNVQGGETFVFWSKGNGAMVLENNTEQTYKGCIEVPKDPGRLPQIYHDGAGGVVVRYPSDWSVNDAYQYTNLGPGKTIGGVKFSVSTSTRQGTNLAGDSGISIEQLPIAQGKECTANLFLDPQFGVKTSTVADNGVDYSVATTTDAAVGNRYEESVWALPGTNPCVAVRYFIHYGAIENYPPGVVREFDRNALVGTFDSIRRTLTVVQ